MESTALSMTGRVSRISAIENYTKASIVIESDTFSFSCIVMIDEAPRVGDSFQFDMIKIPTLIRTDIGQEPTDTSS